MGKMVGRVVLFESAAGVVSDRSPSFGRSREACVGREFARRAGDRFLCGLRKAALCNLDSQRTFLAVSDVEFRPRIFRERATPLVDASERRLRFGASPLAVRAKTDRRRVGGQFEERPWNDMKKLVRHFPLSLGHHRLRCRSLALGRCQGRHRQPLERSSFLRSLQEGQDGMSHSKQSTFRCAVYRGY